MRENKKFKIIKGGLHSSIQKSDKLFSGAFATNTRLMGIFVLYIHWSVEQADFDSDLHQFFYIDAEEFGVESYRSIMGNDADTLYEAENSMMGGLGGSKAELTEKEAVYLVQKYVRMTKASGSLLPVSRDELAFMLDTPLTMTLLEENALFHKLCVPLETDEQAINYFLMRFFAKDDEAVRHMAVRPASLSAPPNKQGETLCKNTIELYENAGGMSFLCESLIENNGRYQLVMSEIYLRGRKILSLHVRSCFFVSTSEAAMMLGRPEYITVYEITGDIDGIQKSVAKLYPGALQKDQDGGVLFLQFKNNNDHLKETVYRLNDDIRGLFYVTEYGQLVAVAYSLGAISRIEKELQIALGTAINTSAKYEFKESVFYEFVQGDFAEFEEFMEYLNEFGPEE
ncbi:MAG: hypothetical protein LBS32_02245 [Clostridiales Family XIII bacterium]|nr:hypothetical protein [Clostridiales Family XIII bacterium]